MRQLQTDFSKGDVKVEVQSLDDLWYLSKIIEQGDLVSGKTTRKIKLGEETERSQKVVKKVVYMTITVEKVEFSSTYNGLRVSGKVLEGPEDVPHGSYHSFTIEEGTVIKIHKDSWLFFHRERFRDACREEQKAILLVVFDRDNASYALLGSTGYSMLSEEEGDVVKKGYDEKQPKSFFMQIIATLESYIQRYHPGHIILASPAFWKDELFSLFKKKFPTFASVTLATCSNTGKPGIEEVLRRDEVRTVLKNDRTQRETALVEEVLREIAKCGLVAYGLEETETAVRANAVRVLIVADKRIYEMRHDQTYSRLEFLMKEVEQKGGEVHLISTDHDAGKQLDGLGGVAALLRFRLQ